ncbi:hypothetical protein PLANPX_0687 [Lacipirellula parvula]|uniref:Uncharacterized protein n=1 Tax=Lacipirellula parvula TaxID=2650471 RepID=A0A5K7X3Y4_9BACT|nr:hypothetical protein PLANPX_0687 [Lacipirellula parvula]
MLNACRRQRISHIPLNIPAAVVIPVLNACRRQRISHDTIGAVDMIQGRCSTPVGVKGSLTIGGIDVGQEGLRAQRLSASKDLSLGLGITAAAMAMCSTPVGVKGSLTTSRHHLRNRLRTCSTPVGVKGSLT